MARKRQLAARGEDAQRRPVPVVLGRQDEDGLGEVKLARDRLHARRVEPFRIENDGERVAGERLGGEHVEGDEAAGHGGLLHDPVPLRGADDARCGMSSSTTTGQ
jgi:hypothetical protein